MLITSLDRKLLRELGRLKGQIATIALVLASGMTSFVSLRGTYESLQQARVAYYDRFGFADVFAQVESAPEALVPRLRALPSVALLETRICKDVALPIEGLARPAYGRLLSLPEGRQPVTNRIHVQSGRLPEPGREDEAVILEAFANAHGLVPGDRVPIVLGGKLRQIRVVGIALSPEYVFAIRAGSLAHDPKRYAVLWMNRAALASAFRLNGAFNELSVTLQPGASEAETLSALDRALERYGGVGAYGRDSQISHRILTQELGQLSALAGMIPLVFLGVAAFLLNLVLGRWIRLQRTDIATLKAVGYSNFQLGKHYLWLVGVVLVPGGLLGVVLGRWLGGLVLGMYSSSFRFPALEFQASTSLVASGLLVSAAAAAVGAILAIRAAVKLPPAEAMRPPAPARYRRSLLDRARLSVLVGPNALMVLREIQRRPVRTLLSSLGIAGAVALLILGRFGWDSMTSYFESTFRREQRQDLQVFFVRPTSPRVVGELARMPGVMQAEGVRTIPVRIRQDHRHRDTALIGLSPGASLRRILSRTDGSEQALPGEGLLVTKTLGELLDLRVGDRPLLELREGERSTIQPVISGFVDESIGLQLYTQRGAAGSSSADASAVSSVLLTVDPLHVDRIEAALRRSPQVIDVADVHADMQRLFDMNASIFDVWTGISIALAASVVFGVVYNNARIALASRSRDLASLRVLGFTRREISSVLLLSLSIEVALAIPLGLVLGKLWAHQFMNNVDQETFRWRIVIAPSTYLLVVTVTLLAASASALWVRRSLDRLDLIEVLKERG